VVEKILKIQLIVRSAIRPRRRLLTSSGKNFPGGRRSALL
jgi:hypothetical protein